MSEKNNLVQIQELKGLGEKSQQVLANIGIISIKEFYNLDSFEIYKRLKQHDEKVSLNFLYAIIGAKENCHWQEVRKNRKEEILMRLDDMGLAPK